MTRGIGEFAPIQDAIPEWAAVLVALLTQLGDVWFLTVVVGVVYWVHSQKREDAAVVLGYAIAGLALIKALKRAFGLPRPERPLVELESLPGLIQPVYEATGMAGGYGFPSGHALMTTIVYVALAHRLSAGTTYRRFGVAALGVAAVSVTRVALGLHYLVDVVAGFGIGVLFLLGAEWLVGRRAADEGTIALAIAVIVSAINLVGGGMDGDGVLVFGAALGAFGGWQLTVIGRGLVAADHLTDAVRLFVRRGTLAGATLLPLLFVVEEVSLVSRLGRGSVRGLAVAAFVTVPVLKHSKYAAHLRTAGTVCAIVLAVFLRLVLSPSVWRRTSRAGRRYAAALRDRLRSGYTRRYAY